MPRVRGNFSIKDGVLLGIDLAAFLRTPNSSGKSAFSEFSGGFGYDGASVQLRGVHLGAGALSTDGNADMRADSRLSGRFSIDLASAVRKDGANFEVAGTLKKPSFNRVDAATPKEVWTELITEPTLE